MYGGDETGGLVLDIGSSTAKVGFAGEETPKGVFPSIGICSSLGGGGEGSEDVEMVDAGSNKTGKRTIYVGHSNAFFRRDHGEVVGAMASEGGAVENWDVLENVYDHALKSVLRVTPSEHPLLVAEPPATSRADSEKNVEMLFEKFDAPAVFLAKQPVLSSFSTGGATSLVVDMGHSGVTCTAVHDGYALTKSVGRSPVGGRALNELMLTWLDTASGARVRPRHLFRRTQTDSGGWAVEDLAYPKTTESFNHYHRMLVAQDFKESVIQVSGTAWDYGEAGAASAGGTTETMGGISVANIPSVNSELPDGTEVGIGAERYRLGECYFTPRLATGFLPDSSAKLPWHDSALLEGLAEPKGLASLILEAVGRCDVDVRKELYGGVLLCGGGSTCGGLKERLERELADNAPPGAKVKVIAAQPPERRHGTWIGGSILASLGSFQQMWMSKAEYQEHGASLVKRKCP